MFVQISSGRADNNDAVLFQVYTLGAGFYILGPGALPDAAHQTKEEAEHVASVLADALLYGSLFTDGGDA